MAVDQKSKAGIHAPAWINAGVYLLSRRMIAAMPHRKPLSIEKDVFPTWTTKRFYGYRAGGTLIDIGTPERYATANDFFASRETAQHQEISNGH